MYPDETTADALEAVHLDRLDADLEMAEMAAVGRAIDAARRAGRCAHQGAVGYLPQPVYKAQEGLRPGQLRCTEGCRRVFDSDAAWYRAMEEALEPVP